MVKILNSFLKSKKSIILYIFFGGLTTFISIGVFALCNTLFLINELISNIFSWISAVTFAFITNKIWVFNSKATGKIIKEAFTFYGGRLATLFIEELLLLVFVTLLNFNGLIIKTVAQFIVLVLNYFISKFFVFRSPNDE